VSVLGHCHLVGPLPECHDEAFLQGLRVAGAVDELTLAATEAPDIPRLLT
jgi:hypothetical protein